MSSGVQDATFGLPDEILAWLGAKTQPYLGLGSGATTESERYSANVDALRARFKENAEAHPVADFAGQYVGLLAGGVPRKVARIGWNELVKRSGKAMVENAVSEGARGFGDGEGSGEARAKQALESGIFGALGGAVQPGMAHLAAKNLDKVKSPTRKAVANYLRHTDGEKLPRADYFLPEREKQDLPRYTGPDTQFRDLSLSSQPPTSSQRRGLLDFW